MTPEKLDAARRLLLALPDGADARDALYANWFHETGETEIIYPEGAAYHAASLHPRAFEPGWTVMRTGLPGRAAQVEAGRDGRVRVVAPPDVVPEAPRATAFAPGMAVRVNPLESAEINGFWHMFSAAWQDGAPPAPRRRLYFAVARERATAFIRAAAQAADPAETWSLKILTGRAPAGRCDPCVLYLPGAAPADAPWLGRFLDAVGPFLGPVSVPGASPLRDGVAEAPDLDDTESFGQRLCGALAAIPPDVPDWEKRARAGIERIGGVP